MTSEFKAMCEAFTALAERVDARLTRMEERQDKIDQLFKDADLGDDGDIRCSPVGSPEIFGNALADAWAKKLNPLAMVTEWPDEENLEDPALGEVRWGVAEVEQSTNQDTNQ